MFIYIKGYNNVERKVELQRRTDRMAWKLRAMAIFYQSGIRTGCYNLRKQEPSSWVIVDAGIVERNIRERKKLQ